MTRPQRNKFRKALDFSGLWEFCKDPDDQGLKEGWSKGFKKDRDLKVPASWNEQSPDLWGYLEPAWYQRRFSFVPSPLWPRSYVKFDSANYHATVWLNGKKLGTHEGGHLPFEFEMTPFLNEGPNILVVRVEGLLKPDRVPPGNVPRNSKDSFLNNFDPPASFDFFPFCGIQRRVWLFTTPKEKIEDMTVTTGIQGKEGRINLTVQAEAPSGTTVRSTLEGFGWKGVAEGLLDEGHFKTILVVPNAKFWEPGSPRLYKLTLELLRDGQPVDQVELPVGIRTVEVKDQQILLNGKPIFLKGFGRHEDYPGYGRYLPPTALKKDYANMRWVGANSFRTTHYPYSEEDLAMADRLGFLVIDETPAVGLFFAKKGLAKRLQLCRQFTKEMIERDKNHPSVILWSLANEPHSKRPAAIPFFKDLAKLARSLDKTRPVTLVSYLGALENSFRFLDVVCVNRYFGWYSEPGDLAKAIPRLSKDLDVIYKKFKKPVLVTEFGADALPGSHANPPVMFSEEYQAELLTRYIELFKEKPYLAGSHVWNLSDFRTAQATHRPNAMNYKGVFTRDRRPKLAAHRLRKLWKSAVK